MEKQGRILVIDDDATLTALLQSRLSERGYEVLTACDGEEGLEAYKSFKPNLILLDILMPKMDGYTFVLLFKKTGDLKTTPIIILTCKENMKDIFAIEGINDYIVKPFKMEYLLAKIDKRLKSKEKKVLVADDAPETVALVESCLKDRSYRVLTAANGLEALQIAKREIPDLMILDILMPKLDGYNVCRMLKFDEKYKQIRIVLLTALGRESDVTLGKEVGADVCLTKPYNADVLLDTMKELLWD